MTNPSDFADGKIMGNGLDHQSDDTTVPAESATDVLEKPRTTDKSKDPNSIHLADLGESSTSSDEENFENVSDIMQSNSWGVYNDLVPSLIQ